MKNWAKASKCLEILVNLQTVNHPPTVAKGILMVGRHPFNNSPRVARRGMGKKRENMYMLDKFRYCPVCGSKHFEESTAKSKRCRNCGFEYFLNASSATAAFILNARGELLVERRKEGPGRGTLDLPGGFCDAGETLEEGMVREVLEETGLTLTEEPQYLFSIPNVYRYGGSEVPTLDAFFLFRVADGLETKAGDDAAELMWIALADIHTEEFGLRSIRHALHRFLEAHAAGNL